MVEPIVKTSRPCQTVWSRFSSQIFLHPSLLCRFDSAMDHLISRCRTVQYASVAQYQVSQNRRECGTVGAILNSGSSSALYPGEQCGSGGSSTASYCMYPWWHRIGRPPSIRPLISCSSVPFEIGVSMLSVCLSSDMKCAKVGFISLHFSRGMH